MIVVMICFDHWAKQGEKRACWLAIFSPQPSDMEVIQVNATSELLKQVSDSLAALTCHRSLCNTSLCYYNKPLPVQKNTGNR